MQGKSSFAGPLMLVVFSPRGWPKPTPPDVLEVGDWGVVKAVSRLYTWPLPLRGALRLQPLPGL